MTEYCYHFIGGVIVVVDGGVSTGSYTCQALPACDAAIPCGCLPQSTMTETCSCDDVGGDITDTCACDLCP